MALRRKVKTEEQKQKDKLINDVIKQIEIDINNNDLTSLHEMLKDISNETLTAFLPEEEEKEMGVRYYDVHCSFDAFSGYSIPVMIETDKALADTQVVTHCIKNYLFSDDFDKRFVDYVKEIDLEEYQDLKGSKFGQ